MQGFINIEIFNSHDHPAITMLAYILSHFPYCILERMQGLINIEI
jgi:hypothetical protein